MIHRPYSFKVFILGYLQSCPSNWTSFSILWHTLLDRIFWFCFIVRESSLCPLRCLSPVAQPAVSKHTGGFLSKGWRWFSELKCWCKLLHWLLSWSWYCLFLCFLPLWFTESNGDWISGTYVMVALGFQLIMLLLLAYWLNFFPP